MSWRPPHRTVLLLAGLLAGLSGCDRSEATSAEPSAPPPAEAAEVTLSPAALKNAKLGMVKAGPATLRPTLAYPGDVIIDPERQARLAAPLAGVVVKLPVREGQTVERGALLAVIQSRELGEAALAYLDAVHTLAFARDALQREQALHKTGASPKERLIQRRHALEEVRIAQKSALARLDALGVPPGRAAAFTRRGPAGLSRYELRAPLAGTVISRPLTLGAGVSAGETLLELGDLSRLQVSFPLRSADLPLVSLRARATVRASQLPLQVEGEVSRIAPRVDRESRTVQVQVAFDNQSGRFKPGLSAQVTLLTGAVQVPLAVPLAALHEVDGEEVVFVQRAPGRFRVTPVTRGRADDERAEITAGLAAGAVVASDNSLVLKSARAQQGE